MQANSSNGHLGSYLCCSLLVGCGQNSAKVEVSKDYLRPSVSEIKNNTLIGSDSGLDQRSKHCGRPKNKQKYTISNNTDGRKNSAIVGFIAGAIANKIVKTASKKVKSAIAKYSDSNASFITSDLNNNYGDCIIINALTDDGQYNFITFKVKKYAYANGSIYGIKLRPVWFNPMHSLPEKTNSGKKQNAAVAISITPTYFVNSTRRTESTLQLLVAGISSDDASKGGFFIPQPTSKGSKSDWEKRPMLAAPPKGQSATFQFEIATAVDSPKILTNLNYILAKGGDDIEEELASVISKLAGVETE